MPRSPSSERARGLRLLQGLREQYVAVTEKITRLEGLGNPDMQTEIETAKLRLESLRKQIEDGYDKWKPRYVHGEAVIDLKSKRQAR